MKKWWTRGHNPWVESSINAYCSNICVILTLYLEQTFCVSILKHTKIRNKITPIQAFGMLCTKNPEPGVLDEDGRGCQLRFQLPVELWSERTYARRSAVYKLSGAIARTRADLRALKSRKEQSDFYVKCLKNRNKNNMSPIWTSSRIYCQEWRTQTFQK